jgi:RNA 2',3'-cyclic 3'-phosphodiesterase
VVEMLRLFVALAPGEGTRAALGREARRLAERDPALRPVRPESMHWTLAFLGATAASEVERIVAALAPVASARAPLPVRVGGLGAFPDLRRPRVVWAGLVEGGDAMGALADEVRGVLRAIGERADERERFHAHVTLARVERRPSEATKDSLTRGALQDTYEPEMLSDLLLMVSEPTATGTRYRPLAVLPLASGSHASRHASRGHDLP